MKKILLFAIVLSFGLYAIAQERAVIPKAKRDVAVKKPAKPIKDVGNTLGEYVPGMKSVSLLEDEEIGQTIYDLQTNSSTQNRLYLYDDGSIGATWTLGFDNPNFSQRGTGYNYYDGNNWGPAPTEKIEPYKTGWPSYTPYGENGELFVCHHMLDGLAYGIREEKGTGDWTMDIQAGPPAAVDISWPRGITTGPTNNIIHFLSVTYATYNGQDNAILYSRSQDGGSTWDIENHFFDELGPDNYTNFGGDVYEFAEPKDGILAFLAGEAWTDLVLMKSTNDGDTWEQTIIWECPYPLHVTGEVTDTFYNCDGSHHLAIDNSGLIHVVFGINRAVADEGGEYWFPGVDGVAYWNENMPAFSDDMDALCPYDDCGYSELVEDYNLIGWSQDINNNGQLDILDDWGTYYLGLSSMVQISIDELNQIFVVYSSVTETYDNGTQSYRHVWTRTSPDGGTSWGTFYDLNGDLIYIFDECVFPSIAANSDDDIYFIYQADTEPGLAVRGDEDPYGDNFTRVMNVLKEDIINAVDENQKLIKNENVSQNYPNPFNETSTVYVLLDEPASLSLEIHNLMGQLVYSIPERPYNTGKVEFMIDGSGLTSGVYFYSVKAGETAVTKKMIIE